MNENKELLFLEDQYISLFNDLKNDLIKLQQLIQENNNYEKEYFRITNKLTNGKENVKILLTDKKYNKLIKNYEKLQLQIQNTEYLCNISLDKLQKLENEYRKKTGQPLLPMNYTQFSNKKFKGIQKTLFLPNNILVAARISKDKDIPEEWILARIINYNEEKQLYEVEDEDPGDESDPEPIRKHHFLQPYRIIPLPNINEKLKEYPIGTEVLAMFPDTTSFYIATVISPPKGKKNPDYILQFADDDDITGQTPQRKVNPKYVLLKENIASNLTNQQKQLYYSS